MILLTRRNLVAGAAVVGGAALIAPTARQQYRQAAYPRRPKGGPAEQGVDQLTSTTVSKFVEIYMGVRFTEQDDAEIGSRLALLTSTNSAWTQPLQWLAKHLDLQAMTIGKVSFVQLASAQQNDIVEELLNGASELGSLRASAMFSAGARQKLMAYKHTIHYLRRLYRMSGIPWRHRGYASWPGIPGDPRAYVEPGVQQVCS